MKPEAESPPPLTVVVGNVASPDSTNEAAEGEAAGLARSRWALGELLGAPGLQVHFPELLCPQSHRTVAVLLRERATLALGLGLLASEADRLLLFAEQLGSCLEGAVWPQPDAGAAAGRALSRIVAIAFAYRAQRARVLTTPPAVLREDVRPTAPSGPSVQSDPSAAARPAEAPTAPAPGGRALEVALREGFAGEVLAGRPGPLPVRGVCDGLTLEDLPPGSRGVYESGAHMVPPIECVVCSGRLSKRWSCSCGAVVCSEACALEHGQRAAARGDAHETHAWAAAL